MRLLVVLMILTFGVVSLAAGAPPTAPGGAMPKSIAESTWGALSRLNGSAFDIAYLQALVPEDEEVVEVAYVATHGGDHAELLQWNQQIIERKNTQVRQMLAILHEAGASAPKRNVGVATPVVKQMRGLSGAALEQAYISFLTKHFDRDLAFAQMAMKKSNRSSVKALARSIVQVESQEKTMVRGWLKKWYRK